VSGDVCHYSMPPVRAGSGPAELTDFLKAADGAAVEIDLSALDFPDTARLQILLAAARHWRDQGDGFRTINASPGFLAGLGQAGLGPEDIATEVTQ